MAALASLSSSTLLSDEGAAQRPRVVEEAVPGLAHGIEDLGAREQRRILAGTMTPQGRPDEVIRSEEELDVSTTEREVGRVRARKVVDHEQVEQVVPVSVEHANTERVPTYEGDSGQIETLPDGSVSIPVFEEQLVVEKRLVVRERVIVRKHTVVEEQRVTADLRRERVEVEADEAVIDRVRAGRETS